MTVILQNEFHLCIHAFDLNICANLLTIASTFYNLSNWKMLPVGSIVSMDISCVYLGVSGAVFLS